MLTHNVNVRTPKGADTPELAYGFVSQASREREWKGLHLSFIPHPKTVIDSLLLKNYQSPWQIRT